MVVLGTSRPKLRRLFRLLPPLGVCQALLQRFHHVDYASWPSLVFGDNRLAFLLGLNERFQIFLEFVVELRWLKILRQAVHQLLRQFDFRGLKLYVLLGFSIALSLIHI